MVRYAKLDMPEVPYEIRPFTSGRYFKRPYINLNPRPYYNRIYTRNSLADYDDPTQLNSFVDALFNVKAINNMNKYDLRTKQPGDKLYGQFLDYLKATDKPGRLDFSDVFQHLLAPYHVLRTNTIDPIAEGWQKNKGMRKLSGFGTAGLNTLMNFGETMDVLANPIKGAFMEKEGALKGIARGFGFSKDGRYNYDTDNIILEVLADPFNWVSLGTFAAGKIGVDAASAGLKTALKKGMKNAGKEVTEESIDYITKLTLNNVRKNPDDIGEAVGKTIRALSKKEKHGVTKELVDDEFARILSRHTNKAINDIPMDVVRGAHKIAEKSDALERSFLKGVGWTSGVSELALIPAVANDAVRYIKNKFSQYFDKGAKFDYSTIGLTKLSPLLDSVPDTILDADDVADETIRQIKTQLRMLVAENDLSFAYEQLIKSKEPLEEINKYFIAKDGVSFEEYIRIVKEELVAKHPEFEGHLAELETLKNIINAKATTTMNEQIIRTHKNMIDAYDNVINVLENLSVDELGAATLNSNVLLFKSALRRLDAKDVPAEFREAVQLLDALMHTLTAYNQIDPVLDQATSKELYARVQELYSKLMSNPKYSDAREHIRLYIDTIEDMSKANTDAIVGAINTSTFIKKLEDTMSDPNAHKDILAALSTRDLNYATEFPEAAVKDLVRRFKDSPAYTEEIFELLSNAKNNSDLEYARAALIDYEMVQEAVYQDLFGEWQYKEIEDFRTLLNEVGSVIDDVTDLLKAPNEVPTALNKALTEYTFKQAQAFVQLRLLQSDEGEVLFKLANELATGSDIGAVLTTLKDIPELKDSITEIQDIAKMYSIYTRTLNYMSEHPDLKDIFPHIFDSIQTVARESMDNFVNVTNRAGAIQRIIDSVEVQLAAIQDKRNALDWAFEKYPHLKDGFKDFLKANGYVDGHAHDAKYDVLATIYLMQQKEYGKAFIDSFDFDKYVMVVYDMETTGLRAEGDQIIQLYWQTFDGSASKMHNATGMKVYPSYDVMRKLTGVDKHEATKLLPLHEQNKIAFDKYTEQFIKNKDGIASEDIANAAIKDWYDLETEIAAANPGKEVVLLGWNNSNFDDNVMRHAARATDRDTNILKTYFNNMKKVDGLKETNVLQGQQYMSDETKTALRQALTTYVEQVRVSVDDLSNVRFGDSLTASYSDKLAKVADAIKETDDPHTRKLIDAAFMQRGWSVETLSNEIKEMSTSLFDLFKSIKEGNSELYNSRLFLDRTTKTFYNKMGLEVNFEGVSNTTQLFAKAPGESMSLAVKLLFDSRPVGRIYEAVGDDILTTSIERESIYRMARRIVKRSDKLKHTAYATKYYEDFKELGDTFKAFISECTTEMPKSIALLDTANINNFDRFAIAEQLYTQAKHYALRSNKMKELNAITEALFKDTNPLHEAMYLVKKPWPMFTGRDVNYFGDDYTSTFFELSLRDTAQRGLTYVSGLKDIQKNMSDRLKALNVLMDKTGLHSANAHASHIFIKDMMDDFDSLIQYIVKEGDDEVPYRTNELKNKLLMFLDGKGINEVDHVIRMSGADLEKYLWANNGRIVFGMPAHNTSDMYKVIIKGQMDHIIKRAEELKAFNIEVYHDAYGDNVYMLLQNKEDVVDRWLKWEHKTYQSIQQAAYNSNQAARRVQDKAHAIDVFAEYYVDYKSSFGLEHDIPKDIMDALLRIEQRMAAFTGGKNIGTFGDMVDRSILEQVDATIPPHLKHVLIPLDVFEQANHFDSIQFNRSIIGVPSSRRKFNQYASGNIFKNYMTAAQSLADVMDTRSKLTQLFFDKANTLHGDLFKGLTKNEILEMLLEHPEYKIAGLLEDKKFGTMVKEFRVKNMSDLDYLLSRPDLNITIMPSHAFLAAYKGINDFKVAGQGFKKVINSWLIGPMKTGYLSSLGFLMRNIIDSGFKNLMLAGDITEAPNMIRHTLETFKTYKHYQDILKQVQKYNDGEVINKSEMFSKRILDRLYEKQGDELNKYMSKDMFQLVHDFVEQGPSAGLSKTQEDVIKKKITALRGRKGIAEPAESLSTALMNNPASRTIMGVNSDIEQVFRLTAYTWSLQHGDTVNEAMYNVLKYHFDYSAKSRAMMFAEYVIPFASFSAHNLTFWADALSHQGWVAGLIRDFYTPAWNFDEEDSLAANRSLQYHVLAGNVVLDNGLAIKLSPSILDAVRLVSDPGEVLGRVAFYFRVPLELVVDGVEDKSFEDFAKMAMTNIPLVGPTIYRQWGMVDFLREAGFEGFLTAVKEGTTGVPYGAGPVNKSLERIEGSRLSAVGARLANVLLPSIFGALNRQLYNYKSDYNKTVRTKDIYVKKSYPKFARKYGKMRKPYVAWGRRTYHKRAYHKRSYAKRDYAKRSYASKSYTPRNYDSYVQERIKYTARGNQMRMPGGYRNIGHVAPSLYRKLYTGTGRARFNSRLLPVTSKNLAAKLRSDWAYLRS